MKRLILMTLLFVAAVAPTAAHAEYLVVPAVFRGTGAHGSVWRTDLVVTNISRRQTQVPVTIAFHRADGETKLLFLNLWPMESFNAKDILAERFGHQNASGIMTITSVDPNARLGAWARIYNTGNGGEFGQSITARPINHLTPNSGFLMGLSGTGQNRTNVGLANPSDHAVNVFLALFDREGSMRSGIALSVNPRSVLQLNDVFRELNVEPLDGALIHYSVSNGAVYAYASIVRNDTGDASFVEGVSPIGE